MKRRPHIVSRRAASLLALAFLTVAGARLSATAMATPAEPAVPVTPAPVPGVAVPPAPSPPPATGAPAPLPGPMDAAASLERVRAAYEYGDIDGVVEWARPVAEGRIPATVFERGHALRYLGIGLYLTGRAPGAEAAFLELLRLRPDSTLDPRTTRPDVVTFFEHVRSRHAAEIRASARENNHKIFVLNFLPPLGQIQNGNRGRAVIYGGLELVSAATAVATYSVLSSWEQPGHQFPGREGEASTLKAVNWSALAVLAVTYVVGVLDGMAGYADLPNEAAAPQRPPGGVAVGLGPSGLSISF